MKRFLSIVTLISSILSFSWGSPAPAVCSFGDPLFDELSHQKVSFEEPKEYKVGKENLVIIKLEKPKLPSGYMVSVFVDTLKSPKQKPEAQGWYPTTIIIPKGVGKHELSIQVNLMYKGS
ncbi:MAG: hypothetical protein PHE60_06190 [Sulfurospirillaceae bacterium]|nr:hypothetical protein [Sulfurospirillaceae bacterium]